MYNDIFIARSSRIVGNVMEEKSLFLFVNFKVVNGCITSVETTKTVEMTNLKFLSEIS